MSVSTPQPPFSAVFVFGDSLSDNGAIASFFGGALPPVNAVDGNGDPVDLTGTGIFYNNNFTNGDVAADVALGQLGIQGDTSQAYDDLTFSNGLQGTNFAVGGATATNIGSISTLGSQVSSFIFAVANTPFADAAAKEAFLADSAASIFIGLNDLNAIGAAALDPVTGVIDQSVIANGVADVVGAISAGTNLLVQEGVGTIILNTLPGGSFFPASNDAIALINAAAGAGTGEALFDGVSAAVNDGIKAIAAGLEAAGTNVEIVDFFSLAAEVQADQETFGFLTLENALSGSSPGAPQELLIDDVPIDQVGFLDTVHFTAEMHEVFGAFQALTLFNEQIDGDDGFDFINGGSGDQTIFSQGGKDIVFAGSGDDLVFAGAGRDKAFGGSGSDVVFGGLDNDIVSGGWGDDVVSGGSGRDVVNGGFGNDVVAGNEGNDLLKGGFGNDLLVDGLGSDKAFGGAGDDVFLYRAAELLGGTAGQDCDYFNGGWGHDTLLIVSDDPIDVGDYLAENHIRLRSIESVVVVSEADLDATDFGAVADQAELADLFGLV